MVKYCKLINAEIFMNLWASIQKAAGDNDKATKVIKALRPELQSRVIEAAKATAAAQGAIAHSKNQAGKPQ